MSLWVSRRSPSQENRLDAAVVNHAAVLRRSFLKSCKSHAIHLVQQFLPTIESALILLACGYGRYEKSDPRRAALPNSTQPTTFCASVVALRHFMVNFTRPLANRSYRIEPSAVSSDSNRDNTLIFNLTW